MTLNLEDRPLTTAELEEKYSKYVINSPYAAGHFARKMLSCS